MASPESARPTAVGERQDARPESVVDGWRIVVTGGAGFIGSHLCDRLLGAGAEVVCLDNLVTGREANIAHLSVHDRFDFVRHDVTEYVFVPGSVDAVLHFASPASPADYLELPIQTLKVGGLGTHNALGLARDKQARFVLASTSEVYGDPLVHPQPEDYWGNVNPIGLRGVYDEAKRYAEALAFAYHRTHALQVRVARIFNTYGPRMRMEDGRAVPTFIRQALAGEPLTIHGDGTQTRSLCYIDDLVDGLLALLVHDDPGPVNLGSPHEISIGELAETVVDVSGSTSRIVYVERPVDDPQRRRPDLRRARDHLGWTPEVSLASGLASSIAWYRDRDGQPTTSDGAIAGEDLIGSVSRASST